MKKVLALALAAVMVMALCGVAFAAATDNVNVTVNGITAGNTLKLYKIAGTSVASNNTLEYTMTSAITLPDAYNSIDKIGAISGDDNVKAMANAFGALFAGLQADYSGNADAAKSVTLAVAPGYYYGIVEGTENAGIVYKPMLINAVPVVDNNTYDKHPDVNVDAKSEPVTIEKTEDLSADDAAQVKTTDNYSVGDTIHFTITTNMPNYPSNATKAKAVITDAPTGLDDDHTTVTVNVGGSDFTAGEDTFAVAEAGKGFTVTFAKAFILAHPGEAIIVEYDAVLEAVDNVTATSTNTATITYNTNPYVDSEVQPGDTDRQNNYGVYVFKYDSDTNNALAGAKFILVKANAAGTGAADATDPDNIVGAEKVTDAEGHVAWEGLKAGTYFVIETAAPAGYRLDPNPHAVVLSENEATEDNPMTDSKAEEYYNDVQVPNTPGASLPSTGGIGTTIFYVTGLIMVLGASVILVSRRRADAK